MAMQMKALGKGSVAAWLARFLTISNYLAWALLIFFTIGSAIYAVNLVLPEPFIAMDPISMPMGRLYTLIILYVALLVTALIVISRLKAIFRTLEEGDPFVPDNAQHLTVIAFTLAAFEGVRLILQGVSAWLASRASELAASSTQCPAGCYPGSGQLLHTYDFMPTILIAIAVIGNLVLAAVFREGSRMREDQQLTI